MLIATIPYLAVALVMSGLLIHFAWERSVVRRYAADAVLSCSSPSAFVRAIALCAAVHRDVGHLPDDQSFVNLPGLTSLGATPVGVLRCGGCCSGKSRVAIVALHSLGIRAAQATLYHVNGRAQHCLVEVRGGDRAVLLDPMYGLYFVDLQGEPIGIAHLRAGIRPHMRCLTDGSAATYPKNQYYEFDFQHTRTANWTKSAVRRAAYRAISWATRNGLDEFRQPAIAEWPQVVLCSFLGTGLLAAMLA